jgi:rRNA maturation endonuclease Nob1
VLLQVKPAVKALSAYNLFAKENMSRIARENPNTPRKELWTILGQDWKKRPQNVTPDAKSNDNVETDEVESKYQYICQAAGCPYLHKRQKKLPDMEKRICPLCGGIGMLLQIKSIESDKVESKFHYVCQAPGCPYLYKSHRKLLGIEKRTCPLCGGMLLQIKPTPRALSAHSPFTRGNMSPRTEPSANGQMGATQESPIKARSRTEVVVLTESDDDLETRIASLKVRRPKSPLPLPLRSSYRTMAAVIPVCIIMAVCTFVSVGWTPEQT